MDGLCDIDVLNESRRRLNAIKLDSVLESNYIEEMIQDHRYSPFPTVYNSERPDVIASAVLEGRVAILWKVRRLYWWFRHCSYNCFNRARTITNAGILPAWFDFFDTYASE